MGLRSWLRRVWEETNPWEEAGTARDMARASTIDAAIRQLGPELTRGVRAAEVSELEEMYERS